MAASVHPPDHVILYNNLTGKPLAVEHDPPLHQNDPSNDADGDILQLLDDDDDDDDVVAQRNTNMDESEYTEYIMEEELLVDDEYDDEGNMDHQQYHHAESRSTVSSLFAPAYIDEIVYEEEYLEEVFEEVSTDGEEMVIDVHDMPNTSTSSPHHTTTVPPKSITMDVNKLPKPYSAANQDLDENKDDEDGSLGADFAPCLDVTDETEDELTDRLYGAMQHAFDALDQHYPTAFLEPNPLLLTRTLTNANASNTDNLPNQATSSSDLHWAVQVSMDAVCPTNYSVPQIARLPDSFMETNKRKDTDQPPIPVPTDRLRETDDTNIGGTATISQNAEGIPTLVSTDSDSATTTSQNTEAPPIPVSTKSQHEKKEEEEEAPFDENEITARKQPTTDVPKDDTPRKQHVSGSNNQEQDAAPEAISPPFNTSTGSSSTAAFAGLVPPPPRLQLAMESSHVSAITSMEEQEDEGILIGQLTNVDSQHKRKQQKPETAAEQVSTQASSSRTRHRSSNQPRPNHHDWEDLEAQQETPTPRYRQESLQKPSDQAIPGGDVTQGSASNWMTQEREKQEAKLESVKTTIRVVLLTLLVVLPFGIGAYLTLEKEKDND